MQMTMISIDAIQPSTLYFFPASTDRARTGRPSATAADRDQEGEVQPDDRDRDDGVERDRHAVVVVERRQREQAAGDRAADDRVDRRAVAVHLGPQPPARDGPVAAERVSHARHARHAAHAAEELADRRDDDDRLEEERRERRLEDRSGEAGRAVDRVDVGRGEQEGEQQDPAADGRLEDGLPQARSRPPSRHPWSPPTRGRRRRSR